MGKYAKLSKIKQKFLSLSFQLPFNNATFTGSPRENLGTHSGGRCYVLCLMFYVWCIVCARGDIGLIKICSDTLTLWHFCKFLLNVKKIGLFLDNYWHFDTYIWWWSYQKDRKCQKCQKCHVIFLYTFFYYSAILR